MTAIIQTERAHQDLRVPPRDHRRRPAGRRGRGLRLPRAQRGGQDDDHPHRPRPDPPDEWAGAGVRDRIERGSDQRSIAGSATSPASSRCTTASPAARRSTYFANLRGGVDQAYQASLIERFEIDPSRKFKELLEGQQAEDRPGHRPAAPARAADPRRADLRPRPARAAELLRAACARRRRRVGRSSSPATSSRRSSGRATASRSSATGASSRSTAWRPCATWPTTRWSCGSPGPVPFEEFRACPASARWPSATTCSRMRVSGAITPVVRAAARYELLDFVSREPSLEETFLAQYGQEAAEVGHGRS